MREIIFLVLVLISVEATGQSWSALGDSLDGAVGYIYNDTAENQLIVCGSFDHIGSLHVDGIAAWDGDAWSPLAVGINTSFSPVYAACRFQGELYSEGLVSPTNIGNESLLRLNGNVWENAALTNGGIGRLCVVGDKLYVLGTFDTIAGIEAFNIACWDGAEWSKVGDNLDSISMFEAALADVAEYQGELYLVGKFDDGHGLANIAKLVNDTWQPVGNGINTWNGYGGRLQVFQDMLYVSGFFQEYEGNVASNIMAWNGTEWFSPQGGVTYYYGEGGFIRDMTTDGDYLYIAGVFDTVGGMPVGELARWDGQDWCGFDVWANNGTNTLVHYQNSLIVAGGFYWVNNSLITHIAQAEYYVDDCSTTGIPSQETNNVELTIHPSPTTSTTTITWQAQNHSNNYQLQLYDGHGRQVLHHNGTATTGSNTLSIDMVDYAKGIYFGRLMVGEENRPFGSAQGKSFKVVKE